MKFASSSVLAATYVLLSSSAAADATYAPIRISFQDLQNGNAEDLLRHALEQVGMISITNIFEQNDKSLQWLPKCMEDSLNVVEQVLDDGTLRRTIATHNVGTKASSSPVLEDCEEFRTVGQTFRETVGKVVDIFATELSAALHLDASKTLLQDVDDQHHHYNLKNIFDQGDHLEHFHCYYSSSSSSSESSNDDKETIEWHTDQGLVLAFTPGMVNGEPTKGFYVQLSDGSTEMVQFDQTDDLVFLMGDGVHQYVNAALKSPLRALPHALRMPVSSDPRVWYGRMVLPPPNAKHPLHERTFGEIREDMIANNNPKANEIGCSGTLVARELQVVGCKAGVASYCWHRCMIHTEYSVSEQGCADQNKTLACVNDDGYLWPFIHDPQFKLGCADLDATNWTSTTDDEDDHHNHGGGGDGNHTGHGGKDKNDKP